MSIRIFVGNLSFKTSNQDLESLFSEAGAVNSAVVAVDEETGRSRGFGFVEMPEAEARTAIEILNGRKLLGRQLYVNQARRSI